MQRYAEYLSCSSPWLGYIPAHWQCKKVGSLFSERKTKVSDKEYVPLSVAKSGIIPQLSTAVKTDAGDNRKLVCAGDFVINSRSDRKGSCGISALDGSVSLINIVLTPRGHWNKQYVHYLMRCQPFSEEYYRNGRGIVSDLWTTRFSEMKSIILPVPPRSEQDQIVRFLDWKVSEINKLIAIKQKQIGCLNEKLLAVINDLSIHGVKDNRQYIITSMDWAPEIPQEWTVSRIRNHFEIRKRIAGSEGYDVFSVTQQGLKVRDVNLYEGQLASNYSGYQFVYPREFAMNHMDLLTGGVGIADHLGVTSPDYRVAANVGRWRLPATAFKNFEIPLPPYDEQVQIVQAIEKEEEKNKAAVDCLKRQIDVLVELKKRIISDVVTGKIDVRDIEIPEYEFLTEENNTSKASETEPCIVLEEIDG